jgi:hypothetical protein
VNTSPENPINEGAKRLSLRSRTMIDPALQQSPMAVDVSPPPPPVVEVSSPPPPVDVSPAPPPPVVEVSPAPLPPPVSSPPPPVVRSSPPPLSEPHSPSVELAVGASSEQHSRKAGMMIVLVVFLFFIAGGYALYKVLTYAPSEPSAHADPAEKGRVSGGLSAVKKANAVRVEQQINADTVDNITEITETSAVIVSAVDVSTEMLAPEIISAKAQVLSVTENNIATTASEIISQFLGERFIGSVRQSENDPRVIIDGRNYSRGDRLEGPHEIRFIAAQKGMLYFQDDVGRVYRRRF